MSLVSPCCRMMLNSPLLMFQAKALQKKKTTVGAGFTTGPFVAAVFSYLQSKTGKYYTVPASEMKAKNEKSLLMKWIKITFLTLSRASIYVQAFIQISLVHIEIIRVVSGFPHLPFSSVRLRCMCNCVEWSWLIVLSRWPLPPLCRLPESHDLCCNVRECYAIVPKLGFASGYQRRRTR